MARRKEKLVGRSSAKCSERTCDIYSASSVFFLAYSPGHMANFSNKHRFVPNPFALAVSHDAMTLQTARGLNDHGWFQDSFSRFGPSCQHDVLRFEELGYATWFSQFSSM